MPKAIPEQKIVDCRELYLRFGGRGHARIVEEMRALGWKGFTDRSLYMRTRKGKPEPGWPQRFGWDREKRDGANGRRGDGEKARGGDKENGNGSLSFPNISQSPFLPFSPSSPRLGVSAVNKKRKHGVAYASRQAAERTVLRPAALEAKRKFNRQKMRRLRKSGDASAGNVCIENAYAGNAHPSGVTNADILAASGRRSDGHAGEAACAPGVASGDACSPVNALDSQDSQDPIDSPDSQDSFHSWLKTLPSIWKWDFRHQVYLYEQLQKVTDGETKRLMIFMPPRHGKSELVTVRYTAWRLRQDPSLNVIVGSYAQDLANRFSRKIKRVLIDDWEVRRRRQDETGMEEMEEMQEGSEKKSDSNSLIPSISSIPVKKKPQRLSVSAVNNNPDNPDASPFPFTKTRLVNRVAEWETTKGGGLRAVGVGAGVTGYGASLIVIDDPVKSREQANSRRFRDKVWDWYNDDLRTRLEPNGTIILIQTRWHQDDLAGRLLDQEDGEEWTVINLPALAEAGELTGIGGMEEMEDEKAHTRIKKIEALESGPDQNVLSNISSIPPIPVDKNGWARESEPPEVSGGSPEHHAQMDSGSTLHSTSRISTNPPVTTGGSDTDPLRRRAGDALWPERFDVADLEDIRRRQGDFSFASLYQQRPVPQEGGLFKREWFTHIVERAPEGLEWKRGYDLAVSTAETADYTATFRVAYDADGNLFIDGGIRRRIGFPEQKRLIMDLIRRERDTVHGIEEALHGQGMMQDLRREARLRGRRFVGVKVKEDKHTRALKWQTIAEDGRLRLVRGIWNREFIDEVCTFPYAAHDDQLDAVSLAVEMWEKKAGKLYVV